MKIILTLALTVMLFSCTIINKPVRTVTSFNLANYQGLWYEIARLDHSFEKELTDVTAQYNINEDWVEVINRGYNPITKEWVEATGRAEFINSRDQGLLKVSFFRPFYGAYQIHDVVKNDRGQYIASLVIGPDLNYAWFLSRTPKLPKNIKKRFVLKIKELGINPDSLIWL